MTQLSATPVGYELEEYLAAVLQVGKNFIEKSVTERREENVLELDIVASRYTGARPSRCLFEVKSGKWGFPDIFKLRGWLDYLNLRQHEFDRVVLVVTDDIADKDMEFYGKVSQDLNIILLPIRDVSTCEQHLESHGFVVSTDKVSQHVWRYSYRAERRMLEELRKLRKVHPNLKGAHSALEYYRLINDAIFFIRDPRLKISSLYLSYRQHPRLALGLAQEMAGRDFDAEHPDRKTPTFREALFEGKHVPVQACMYLEHRARLSILRFAVDTLHLASASSGVAGARTGDRGLVVIRRLLPDSFQAGVESIRRDRYVYQYPLFWQIFLWGWGGFLLTDRLDEEYAMLAEQTGMPVEEVPNAMAAYESLFGGNWFADVKGTHLRLVKMVPAQFQGIGAFRRRLVYDKSYADLGYTDRTPDKLASWEGCLATL